MARMMLDVVPEPWQGVRIIDDALVDLRKRYSDEEISRCRFGLVDEMKRVLVEASGRKRGNRLSQTGERAAKLFSNSSARLLRI